MGAGVGRSMSAVMDMKKCWGGGSLCEASLGKVLEWFGSLECESKKKCDPGRWSCQKNESLRSEVVLDKKGLGSWRMEKGTPGPSSWGDLGLKGVGEL